MTSLQLTRDQIRSPTGMLHLVIDSQQRVRALDWDATRMHTLLQRHYAESFAPHTLTLHDGRAPAAIRAALAAYFDGDLQALDSLETCTGGTAFQRTVWSALRRIGVGSATSYGALAAQIGNPKAVRAVGLANGQNPIGIIVPCHRVIGADGSLTGFAGGLDRKRWLLKHEGALA